MTPRILSLTVCPISKIEFWTGLADVASRLRYLDLRLGNLSRRSNSSYLAEWLDSMPPVLELNIICIRVGVDSRMVHRPLTPGHTTTQRPPLRLATSIPSLRYIALDHDIVSSGTTALPMVENASWYRAWGPAEERQVHTIPSHVGVRVHGYLHADDMESLEKLEELFSPSEVARKD
ncbi:hypothetical protein SCP_1603040 [Sparassis crispa]|uniref:Uncharacterized protein n=1 Tax=Sparassis crispa TaxID=139825 RepID=A0A401H5L0_9APHY|nr:hypothetical protein SCP_1603040 [Sparassis crispa]GBE89640.1 hypothetical protein SCP_1603040 [Sparassis crispa]